MDLVLWALAAVVIGAFGTLVGVGGGIVLVPLLLFVYPHEAPGRLTAISLAVVFANAVSGSAAYFRLRRPDYRSGMVLALATIPGAVLGALVVTAIPTKTFDLIMGVTLLLVALRLLQNPGGTHPLLRDGPMSVERHLVDAHGVKADYRFNLGLAALMSTGIGFLASLLGVGGGIMQVPLLTIFFSFPAHVATSTSQFVLMITSASATATHILHHDIGPFVSLTVALAAGMVVGGQLGAAISRRVSPAWLIRLLTLALAIAGVRLLIQGL
jgi:uncharacterized membrane protein YfcA